MIRRTLSQVSSSTIQIVPVTDVKHNNNAILVQSIKSMKRDIKQDKGNTVQRFYNIKKSIGLIRESTCKICQNTFHNRDLYALCLCLHKFCQYCGQNYLTYKINAFESINCPEVGCSAIFDKDSHLYTNLAKQLKEKHKKFQLFERTRDNPNLKLCPVENCQGILNISLPQIQCKICQKIFCNKCLYIKHDGECTNFQIDFLQNNYKFRQCSRCKNLIQKSAGCNHITCQCGYQFCYRCGAQWDKDPCHIPNLIPPEPQSNCVKYSKIALKILIVPLVVILSTLLFILTMVSWIIIFLLLSIFYGSVEYFYDICVQTIERYVIFALVVLGMPFILLAGIFIFLYRHIYQLRHIFENVKNKSVAIVQQLLNF